jgi:hypothetical protein
MKYSVLSFQMLAGDPMRKPWQWQWHLHPLVPGDWVHIRKGVELLLTTALTRDQKAATEFTEWRGQIHLYSHGNVLSGPHNLFCNVYITWEPYILGFSWEVAAVIPVGLHLLLPTGGPHLVPNHSHRSLLSHHLPSFLTLSQNSLNLKTSSVYQKQGRFLGKNECINFHGTSMIFVRKAHASLRSEKTKGDRKCHIF